MQYHLAQLLDNHVRLLPNAEGVHMQWYNQSTCSEKVIFKSMQDVFKHAQLFIESKQQRRKFFDQSRTVGRPNEIKPLPTVEDIKPKCRQIPTQPLPHQQASPLYKTRLCERFETEGTCPYGPKCNFAHGINELRGKDIQENAVPIPTTVATNQILDSGNQLFKTRLCEKFIKEKFCQYGPKCHFGKNHYHFFFFYY